MSDLIRWDIEVPTPKPASPPSDASTAPQAVALLGAPAASPSAVPDGRPGHPLPLPKQTRGGDVKNPPHAPVPAVNHLGNRAQVQPLGLMWAAHVHELQEKLHRHGVERTDTQVDTAIQGARESQHDDDGIWPNIDNDYGWWLILPRVADYLDVDYDLIFEVAP